MDAYQKLSARWPNWTTQKPPAATNLYKQTEGITGPGAVAGDVILTQACQITLSPGEVAVLSRYGIRALEQVPSTDYVGLRWQALDEGAFCGKIEWQMFWNSGPLVQSTSELADGTGFPGFLENREFAFYRGAEPLILVGQGTFYMNLAIRNPAAGGTIAPDGVKFIATIAGYRIHVPA